MTVALSGDEIALFLVVLARAGGLILSAPIIGDAQVPRLVKVLLAIVLSVVLVQVHGLAQARVPVAVFPFALLVLIQLLVGITLGLVARLLFFSVQTAGEIVSMQIGLSNASIFNPLTKEPNPILGQLYTLVAALTFLALNGDALVVGSLARSFAIIPLTTAAFTTALMAHVVNDAIMVTALGLQIALPIGISIFAATVVLGVVSRALPQLNVFVLSLPINMLLGLLALAGSAAGMIAVIAHLTGQVPQSMLQLTR